MMAVSRSPVKSEAGNGRELNGKNAIVKEERNLSGDSEVTIGGQTKVKDEGDSISPSRSPTKVRFSPVSRSAIKHEAIGQGDFEDEDRSSHASGSSPGSHGSSSSSRSPFDGTPEADSDAESSASVASSSKSALSPSSPRKRRNGTGEGISNGKGLTAVATSLPPGHKRTKKASTAGGFPPQIVDHLPRAEDEALATFTVLGENTYSNKHIGRSQGHEWGLVCECNYRPGRDELSAACSEEAHCINRLTQVECMAADCRCGSSCQNQRFQKKEYADVEVIQTEKKGFGLRAGSAIPAEAFIYEYIGEVVEESDFQKRMRRYHDERIPHFYFMMLQRDEYLDATKRGGIARFINHSCNPNCYVAKWHVGKHYRMGIFSQRDILKGEELTFNYNVDRYGNEAQPCYCGEPNCVGQLGGKTQTDIGGMSNLYIEALGIVDAVEQLQARGNKKQKSRILDEDFTPTLHPLEEDEVPTVATAIRQAATNRSILTKLLQRLEMTDDVAVHKRFVRLHGFVLMSGVLTNWKDDPEVLISCMRILAKWPLIARNKVVDTGVEGIVASLREVEEQEELANLAQELYDAWQQLSLEFRIARKEEADAGGDAEAEDQDAAGLARSRRRREYEEDSHDDIQSRMDHELDQAQAPNDVSDRLRGAVPRPLGVLAAGGGTPGAHRFRGGWGGGAGAWRPAPSRAPSTPLGLGGHKPNPQATPSTPQTPDERSTLYSSTAPTATPPSSATGPSAAARTMSIEEIIRRANEAQALERSKMEEDEERRRSSGAAASATGSKRSSSGKSRENGTSSSSTGASKGKHRSASGNGDDSASKRRKRSHRSTTTTSTSSAHLNGSSSSSSSTPQTQQDLEHQIDKRLRLIVGEVVVQVMSKYKDRLEKETFKKHARELTEVICAKEKKNPKFWPPVLHGAAETKQRVDESGGSGEGEQQRPPASSSSTSSPSAAGRYLEKLSASGEKREKMKSFAKEYTQKLVARKGLPSGGGGGSAALSAGGGGAVGGDGTGAGAVGGNGAAPA